MTIAHARQASDDVIVAEGERYDVEKVLEAMLGIVESFAAFGRIHGLAEPYTPASPCAPRSDDDWVVKLLRLAAEEQPIRLPYGDHTPRLIRTKVLKEKEWVDAGGIRHSVEAPPYRFDLYPLGQEPLYANFGLCREKGLHDPWVTQVGEAWPAYDPAPYMRIFRHLPPPDWNQRLPRPDLEMRMTLAQRKVLTGFLEPQRARGVDYEIGLNGLVVEPVVLRFPHAAFGAGHGEIRIALLIAGGD